MKKFTKQITKIIIHCTATPAHRDVSVADVTAWHIERGFETIGYHYLISIDGKIEKGRDESLIGAHCLGQNDCSIGVAYVGGINAEGRPADTRTPSQRVALAQLIVKLKQRCPAAQVYGHNEFTKKDCPCFNVGREYR